MSDKTVKLLPRAREQKAFTLIELLVVIAIIALLLSIVMPSLAMAKERAKRLICATHMKSLGVGIVMYAGQQDDELPMNFYQHDPGRRNASNAVATYFLGGYDMALDTASSQERLDDMLHGGGDYEATGRGVTNLGYLFSEGLLEDVADVVYCDSNKSTLFSYNAYGGKAGWPKGVSDTSYASNRIRVSYSYLPQASRSKHPSMPQFPDAAYKLRELDSMRSVVVDLLNDDPDNGNSMAHKRGNYYGVNMLFGDGSVAFKLDKENVIKDGGNMIERSNGDDPVAWRHAIRVLETQ